MRVIVAIARVTGMELLRDRILYSALFLGVLLNLVGMLAANLTFIHPERVLLDIGLAGLTWTLVGLAIVMGGGLIQKEIERRTLFVALSHPISRTQFFCGKYLGLAGVLTLNLLALVAAFAVTLLIVPDASSALGALVFWEAAFFVWLQALMMSACTLMLSTGMSPLLSVFSGLGVFLIGNNISQLVTLGQKQEGFIRFLYQGFAKIWPNLEYFQIGTMLSYQMPLPQVQISQATLYSIAMVVFFIFLGALILEKKDL